MRPAYNGTCGRWDVLADNDGRPSVVSISLWIVCSRLMDYGRMHLRYLNKGRLLVAGLLVAPRPQPVPR